MRDSIIKFACAALLTAVFFMAGDILAFEFESQEERLEYQKSIPVTTWPEISGTEPISYEEWRAQRGPEKPFDAEYMGLSRSAQKSDSGLIVVLVNNNLYGQIESSLNQYITDLNNESYDVKLYTISGGLPESIRTLLQDEYQQGMIGALLIGDLPVPWFEYYCWEAWATFPIDLYYMDLNGVWEDTDSDGIMDEHTGDLYPEIFVGRLTAGPMTMGGSEANLVNNYFAKNHTYRTGGKYMKNRALIYIDDDWNYWQGEYDYAMSLAYQSRTCIHEGAETISDDYEVKLSDNYEFIQVMSHSGPSCHYFKIGDEWSGGTTCNNEVINIDPKAYFYNLFACSNSRYVENDYMGGWYIFCQDQGLASIGSAKTGSMLYFEYFYGPFGQGKSIGRAYFEWFYTVAGWGFPDNDLCWFYGMTLCGDPMLRSLYPEDLQALSGELPGGLVGETYMERLQASGGLTPYSWEFVSGELPPGLSLADNGLVSGTPSLEGIYSFQASLTDDNTPPQTDTGMFSIQVDVICGDVNGDSLVNLLDVIFLINFLYKEGPAPVNPDLADVDASGGVNLLDVTYLIDYIYNFGPPPQCN